MERDEDGVLVLSDAVPCPWCGVDAGVRCVLQSPDWSHMAVHLARTTTRSDHEAWIASGRSAYMAGLPLDVDTPGVLRLGHDHRPRE